MDSTCQFLTLLPGAWSELSLAAGTAGTEVFAASLSLCKLWPRCVRQPRWHGLGASWGEGIKAFQLPGKGWSRDRAGSRLALMETQQHSHCGSRWGRCWSWARTFLRRAVFLCIAQNLMESQGGAKGFGIMGILTPACLCVAAPQKGFLLREAFTSDVCLRQWNLFQWVMIAQSKCSS